MALVDVLQSVGALAGSQQVGGNRGVVRDAGELDAAAAQHVVGGLRLVHVLRRVRLEPLLNHGVLRGTQVCGELGHTVPLLIDDRQRHHIALSGRGIARDVDGKTVVLTATEPGVQRFVVDSDVFKLDGFCLGRGAVGRNGGEDALAQVHAELEVVEAGGDLGDVRRLELQIVRGDRQLDVGDHLRELAVEAHLVDALTEVVGGDALELVGAFDEPFQAAVLRDPLGGGLLPHFRHAGQVVRRIPAQRREVRVLRRRQPVLVLHFLGRKPGHGGHAAGGIHQRGGAVHKLDVVTVAADQHDLEVALGTRLGHQRGDDVVRLEVLLAQGGDTEVGQDVFDDRHLALELRRRGLALRLVFRKALRAERLTAHIEGDSGVRRLLVRQNVGEHG